MAQRCRWRTGQRRRTSSERQTRKTTSSRLLASSGGEIGSQLKKNGKGPLWGPVGFKDGNEGLPRVQIFGRSDAAGMDVTVLL